MYKTFRDIEHKKMVTLVIEQVTDAIIEGNLKCGDRIPPEMKLMEMLGVGRSTVREALKAIETLGLIERTNGGTFVRVPQSDNLTKLFQCFVALKGISFQELIDARIMVETQIAELLSERATEEDLDALESIAEEAEQFKGPIQEKGKRYLKFHIELARRTKNTAIIEIIEMLKPVLLQSQNMTIRNKRLREGGADKGHRFLLQAIRSRNKERARKAIQDHILDVSHVIKDKNRRTIL
jgi:GntR family transcriptional repressor for pyruvate dehydrogenase complex